MTPGWNFMCITILWSYIFSIWFKKFRPLVTKLWLRTEQKLGNQLLYNWWHTDETSRAKPHHGNIYSVYIACNSIYWLPTETLDARKLYSKGHNSSITAGTLMKLHVHSHTMVIYIQYIFSISFMKFHRRTEGHTETLDRRKDGGTDNAKPISLHLWRGIKTTLTMNKFFIKFIYSFIYITTGTIWNKKHKQTCKL